MWQKKKEKGITIITMLCFLIMAGGFGERFWPLSTNKKPKQLLSVYDKKSLLRHTFERILPISDLRHIFICTNKIQIKLIKKEIPELNDDQFIVEPDHRDTAAAIAFGTLIISQYITNPIIAAIPSDHYIGDEMAYRKVLVDASVLAEEEKIITIGIKPNRPETGYGYLEVSQSNGDLPVKVVRFVEKPDYETAKSYLLSNRYLWNSGIFVFSKNTILENFREFLPEHYRILSEIEKIIIEKTSSQKKRLAKIYQSFPKISIDYGVMEKAKCIYVIPASFGWNDVGGYLSFSNFLPKDKQGNNSNGTSYYSIDSSNNIIISSKENWKISLIGVSDSIIVIGEKNVLVCSKAKAQDIKKIAEMAKNGDKAN